MSYNKCFCNTLALVILYYDYNILNASQFVNVNMCKVESLVVYACDVMVNISEVFDLHIVVYGILH